MQVTITEEHLDRAIALAGSNTCQNCILSQAVSDAIGEPIITNSFKGEGYARKLDETPNFPSYIFKDKKITDLMNDFDMRRYKIVRSQLPITFELIERDKNVNN